LNCIILFSLNYIVTHTDIVKPENILISDNGRAVIADFGIAYALGLSTDDKNSKASKHAKKSLSNGTFQYMSPERLTGNCSRLEASDVWSAGKTLFDCVTRADTASKRCTYWHILRTAEEMKEIVKVSVSMGKNSELL
jgi:serine/threonine protein kinase